MKRANIVIRRNRLFCTVWLSEVQFIQSCSYWGLAQKFERELKPYEEVEKYYRLCAEVNLEPDSDSLLWDPLYAFACVLHEQGKHIEAKAQIERLRELGWVEQFLEQEIEDRLEIRIKRKEVVFGRQLTDLRRQIKCKSGRIDLLACDGKKEDVIIELKKDEIKDEAIVQIIRYIDDCKHPGKRVSGILCGSSVPDATEKSSARLRKERGYEIEAWEYHFRDGQLSLTKKFPAG